MSSLEENKRPRRRRIEQGNVEANIQSSVPVEKPYREQPVSWREPAQETPSKPHRIVVASEETPDWMVSAERVTGAAGRRGASTAKENKREEATEKHVRVSSRVRESQLSDAPRQNETGSATARTGRTQDSEAGRRTSSKRPVKKKKPANRRKKNWETIRAQVLRGTLLAVGLCILTVGVVMGVRGGAHLVDVKNTLDRGDGVFYPNIYINNIPLGGKTLDEAAVVVKQQIKTQADNFSITLRTTDGSGRVWNITSEDLDMQYDVADQLDQLWSIGHTGSSSTRYEQAKALETDAVVRYTTLSCDMSAINQILNQIKAEVDVKPIDAKRISDDSKWPPFSYTDDVPGQELNVAGLNEQILDMVNRLESGVVDLAPTVLEATTTRKMLEGQIVQLASFDTTIGATSDPGRFINIENGTNRFNHLIIKSGETVSFNKVAGKRTLENGYAEAPELAYGDYRSGVGGGICQVSSTLYNAVVNAGLEVKTRYQHSLASNYVALGLDATVQDDRLDFVFKNTTNADIYISTSYYKEKGYWHTRFTIHGRPDPQGYTYKLESEVVEEIPIPEPAYIADTKAEYVVYDDESKQTSKGEKGYVVDVYLVTMDSKGLVVSREKKYTDTYKAKQPKVYVGVTPRETPIPMYMPD